MENIKKIIKEGILNDLHICERCFRLNKSINDSKKKIPKGVKTDIAGILYNLTYTELVLSLARIYDNPSGKYPTRCLKALYNYLETNVSTLCLQESKDIVLSRMSKMKMHNDLIDCLSQTSESNFNQVAHSYLETIELNDPIYPAVQNIKKIRDKFVAHNEDVTIDTIVPYSDVEQLLIHAKFVVSFFSVAYTGINLITATGNFYLGHSSSNWERVYYKFLEQSSN